MTIPADLQMTLYSLVVFLLIILASRQIGEFFPKIKLPLITIFIGGVIADD